MRISSPTFVHSFFERYISDNVGNNPLTALKDFAKVDPIGLFKNSLEVLRSNSVKHATYVLPYGYTSLIGGHMICLLVDMTRNRIAIVNSGAGLTEFHSMKNELYNVVQWYSGEQCGLCAEALRFLVGVRLKLDLPLLSLRCGNAPKETRRILQGEKVPQSIKQTYEVLAWVFHHFQMAISAGSNYDSKVWSTPCPKYLAQVPFSFLPEVRVLDGELYSRPQIVGTCTYHALILCLAATQSQLRAVICESMMRQSWLVACSLEYHSAEERQLGVLLAQDYKVAGAVSPLPPMQLGLAEGVQKGIQSSPTRYYVYQPLPDIEQHLRNFPAAPNAKAKLLNLARLYNQFRYAPQQGHPLLVNMAWFGLVVRIWSQCNEAFKVDTALPKAVDLYVELSLLCRNILIGVSVVFEDDEVPIYTSTFADCAEQCADNLVTWVKAQNQTLPPLQPPVDFEACVGAVARNGGKTPSDIFHFLQYHPKYNIDSEVWVDLQHTKRRAGKFIEWGNRRQNSKYQRFNDALSANYNLQVIIGAVDIATTCCSSLENGASEVVIAYRLNLWSNLAFRQEPNERFSTRDWCLQQSRSVRTLLAIRDGRALTITDIDISDLRSLVRPVSEHDADHLLMRDDRDVVGSVQYRGPHVWRDLAVETLQAFQWPDEPAALRLGGLLLLWLEDEPRISKVFATLRELQGDSPLHLALRALAQAQQARPKNLRELLRLSAETPETVELVSAVFARWPIALYTHYCQSLPIGTVWGERQETTYRLPMEVERGFVPSRQGLDLVHSMEEHSPCVANRMFRTFRNAGFAMLVWEGRSTIEIEAGPYHVVCTETGAEVRFDGQNHKVSGIAGDGCDHNVRWTDLSGAVALLIEEGRTLLVLMADNLDFPPVVSAGRTVFDRSASPIALYHQSRCMRFAIRGQMLDLAAAQDEDVLFLYALYSCSGNAALCAMLHWYARELCAIGDSRQGIFAHVRTLHKAGLIGSALRHVLLGDVEAVQHRRLEGVQLRPRREFKVNEIIVQETRPTVAETGWTSRDPDIVAFQQSNVTTRNITKKADLGVAMAALHAEHQQADAEQLLLPFDNRNFAAVWARTETYLTALQKGECMHVHLSTPLAQLGKAELAFEGAVGRLVRRSQHARLEQMLNQQSATIYEAIMGSGKSAVLVPVLVLDAVFRNSRVVVVQPPHLVHAATRIVMHALALFGLEYELTVRNSGLKNQSVKTVLVMSDAAIKVELLHLRQGRVQLRPVTLILDEIDSLLDPLSSNYNEPFDVVGHPAVEDGGLDAYYDRLLGKDVPLASMRQGFSSEELGEKLAGDRVEVETKMEHNHHYGGTQLDLKNPMAVPYTSPNHPSEESSFSDPDLRNLLTVQMLRVRGLRSADWLILRRHFHALAEALPPELLDKALQSVGIAARDLWRPLLSKYSKSHVVQSYYLKHIVFPEYSTCYQKQYNISFMDVLPLGSRTVAFSGTTSIHMPLGLGFDPAIRRDPVTAGSIKAAVLFPNDRIAKFKTVDEVLDHAATQFDAMIDEAALFRDWQPINVAKAVCRLGRAVTYFTDGRAATVGDGKPFVYYDATHIIGVDHVLPAKARGLVVVRPESTFTRVAQAMFRMRGLHRGQSVHFCTTGALKANNRSRLLKLLVKNEERGLQVRAQGAARQNLSTLQRVRMHHTPKSYQQLLPYDLPRDKKYTPCLAVEGDDEVQLLARAAQAPVRPSRATARQKADERQNEQKIEQEKEHDQNARYDDCFKKTELDPAVGRGVYEADAPPALFLELEAALARFAIVLSPLAQQMLLVFQPNQTAFLLYQSNRRIMIVHPIEVDAAQLERTCVFDMYGAAVSGGKTTTNLLARMLIGGQLDILQQVELLLKVRNQLADFRHVVRCLRPRLRWLLRNIQTRSIADILQQFRDKHLQSVRTLSHFLIGTADMAHKLAGLRNELLERLAERA